MSLLVNAKPPAAGHTQVGTDCGEIVASQAVPSPARFAPMPAWRLPCAGRGMAVAVE
jgi:hypothetical protein